MTQQVERDMAQHRQILRCVPCSYPAPIRVLNNSPRAASKEMTSPQASDVQPFGFSATHLAFVHDPVGTGYAGNSRPSFDRMVFGNRPLRTYPTGHRAHDHMLDRVSEKRSFLRDED
jgi:hypothetical protein